MKKEVTRKTYMNYIINNSDLTINEIEKRSDNKIKDMAIFIKRALKYGYDIRSYSGRGMYGMQTIAVDVDYYGVNDAISELKIKGLQTDTMGQGHVVYIG